MADGHESERDVEQIGATLRACGVEQPDTADVTPLEGGTYNAVWHVALPDGRTWVVKIPPPHDAPQLTYEQGLLRAEAAFYEYAAGTGVPVPELVHAHFDPTPPAGAHLVMTALPGTPWPAHAPGIAPPDRARLRRTLGRHVARLHAVTGPGFGYPALPLGPLSPSWREAFTTMLNAVLHDARRYRADLPHDPEHIAALLAPAAEALDDVTRPALVHFDLWDGNILLNKTGDADPLDITGLIDGERMFWGDPLADFVSLALFQDIGSDSAFLDGYTTAGGHAIFDASARLRLALYRCYLYLIMTTEGIPRHHDSTHTAWTRQNVAPQLRAALREVAIATGQTP